MEIPKKISPDRIKESFVEVRYESQIPFSALVGIFYSHLDSTYTYTNRGDGAAPVFMFYNEKIKIELNAGIIVFNCLNEYLSWPVYKYEIEKALIQLTKNDVIDKYFRIGIRYVSEYPNMDIQELCKFNFSFGLPDIKSDTVLFRSDFKFEGYRAILNLVHMLPHVINDDEQEIVPITKIDIDIIDDNDSKTLEEILIRMDNIHNKEKELFFSLLKDDFLKTLNPVY